MAFTRKLCAFVVAAGIATLAVTAAVSAQTTVGVTATEIKVGNTNPYSGPASAYVTIVKYIGA
jgi:branched-chain amino acid transport system substrate-binding protein